jgi:DNA repair protein RecO (recombination protein O)
VTRRAPAAPLQAYVLHRYDWSETSLIVELFTRERGRVVVAAKGAKRPYSQLRPVLLPFQRLLVQLGRTPADEASEVHTLRTAEWAGGVPVLAGGALFRGFYLNELLLKGLARQDPHEALFDAYAATLPALAGPESSATTAALRAFELRLLQDSGWLPELDRVTLTRAPLRPGSAYALHAETGVLDGEAEALPGAALLAAQQALQDGDLPALRAACAAPAAAWRAQLRGLLQYHLGTGLLRTRQVMLEVQRLTDPRDSRDPRDPRPDPTR